MSKAQTSGAKTYHSIDDFLREKMPHYYVMSRIEKIADRNNGIFVNRSSIENEMANFLDENGIDIANLPDYLKNDKQRIMRNLSPRYIGRKMAESTMKKVLQSAC